MITFLQTYWPGIVAALIALGSLCIGCFQAGWNARNRAADSRNYLPPVHL